MSVNISVQVPRPAEDKEGGCSCTKKSWPTIIMVLGIVACALVCLVSVLSLMNFEGIPSIILALYLIALATLACMVELRRFKLLRTYIYHVVKYCYFLTSYYGRGLFYMFLGSIVLDSPALNLIAGGCVIGFGALMMIIHCTIGLPEYVDWQVVQEIAAETARRGIQSARQNVDIVLRPGSDGGAGPRPGAASGDSFTVVVPPPNVKVSMGDPSGQRNANPYSQPPLRHQDELEVAGRRANASLEDEYYNRPTTNAFGGQRDDPFAN